MQRIYVTRCDGFRLRFSGNCPAEVARSWRDLTPGAQTEQELVFLLGQPDSVSVTTTYEEFTAHRASSVNVQDYELNYWGFRKDLPVLNGPFGRADSAAVAIIGGKFAYIKWEYTGITVTALSLRESGYTTKLATTPFGDSWSGLRTVDHGQLLFVLPPKSQKATITFGDFAAKR